MAVRLKPAWPAVRPRKVPKTNGEIFRALLKSSGMTVAEAAEILRRPLRTTERWVQAPGAASYRRMHDDTLEVFRLRLAEWKK
jgi:hypothetical protein